MKGCNVMKMCILYHTYTHHKRVTCNVPCLSSRLPLYLQNKPVLYAPPSSRLFNWLSNGPIDSCNRIACILKYSRTVSDSTEHRVYTLYIILHPIVSLKPATLYCLCISLLNPMCYLVMLLLFFLTIVQLGNPRSDLWKWYVHAHIAHLQLHTMKSSYIALYSPHHVSEHQNDLFFF